MEKIVLVWHGHHQESSPLEDLGESFKERKETILYRKSLSEDLSKIARRKKLFKHLKGGIEALPRAYQKAYARYMKTGRAYDAVDDYDAHFSDMFYAAKAAWEDLLSNPTKGILKLHKEQCGCGWTAKNNDIFYYKP